jgi:hypothetical protein
MIEKRRSQMEKIVIGRMSEDREIGYANAVAEVARILEVSDRVDVGVSTIVREVVAAMIWSRICMECRDVIYVDDLAFAVEEIGKQLGNVKL